MLRAARILAVLALITMSLLAGPSFGGPGHGRQTSYDQGIEFFKKGQYDQAIASFTKAIQASPKNAVYYNSRGLAYYDNKSLDKAIADYNKAIQLDPKFAVAYNNRGLAYYYKGAPDRAMADYNKAIAAGSQICRGLRQPGVSLLLCPGLRQILRRLRQGHRAQPQN